MGPEGAWPAAPPTACNEPEYNDDRIASEACNARWSGNTARRNVGWGDLHIYNWESHKPTLTIDPIDKKCCYRDARWSPDGMYILFVFQKFDSDMIELYYVKYSDIQEGKTLTPMELPGEFLTQRDKPQPAIRPTQ